MITQVKTSKSYIIKGLSPNITILAQIDDVSEDRAHGKFIEFNLTSGKISFGSGLSHRTLKQLFIYELKSRHKSEFIITIFARS